MPCNIASAAARIRFMLCCYWGQVLSGSPLGRDGYKSSWLFFFFCNWKLDLIRNPICNYFQVIRFLINFTSNHLLQPPLTNQSVFLRCSSFHPSDFSMTFFHQILCSLHASAPSGNWMSNLRNETKILHLPKAQRNQALAAFVNWNHLNKKHFFSGLKYLSSKSQSNFQPQDINQSSVTKGAGTFHSAGQSKEGSVRFGTSQHPLFMKLLPDHLWH